MTPPIPYKTIVGRYLAPDGTPVGGQLRFIPSVRVADAAGNEVIPPLPIFATLDGSGYFAVNLACTDNPDVTPMGWTWVMDELFPGGSGYSGNPGVRFQLPMSAPSTVQIGDLTSVIADPTAIYASFSAIAALDARLTAVEASASVTVAAVVVHPFVTAGL